MLPPYPTNESVEFFVVCILGPGQRRSGIAARPSPGRQTRPEVHELDEPDTVRPPDQTELLSRQKQKPPCGFRAL